jgi:hypothetical protein
VTAQSRLGRGSVFTVVLPMLVNAHEEIVSPAAKLPSLSDFTKS